MKTLNQYCRWSNDRQQFSYFKIRCFFFILTDYFIFEMTNIDFNILDEYPIISFMLISDESSSEPFFEHILSSVRLSVNLPHFQLYQTWHEVQVDAGDLSL